MTMSCLSGTHILKRMKHVFLAFGSQRAGDRVRNRVGIPRFEAARCPFSLFFLFFCGTLVFALLCKLPDNFFAFLVCDFGFIRWINHPPDNGKIWKHA